MWPSPRWRLGCPHTDSPQHSQSAEPAESEQQEAEPPITRAASSPGGRLAVCPISRKARCGGARPQFHLERSRARPAYRRQARSGRQINVCPPPTRQSGQPIRRFACDRQVSPSVACNCFQCFSIGIARRDTMRSEGELALPLPAATGVSIVWPYYILQAARLRSLLNLEAKSGRAQQ